MATCDVYLVRYKGLPAFHDAIYVETEKDRGGWLYHVIGNNVGGYKFEKKPTNRPENSQSYSPPKMYKGKVAQTDLSKVEEICRQIPPDKEQFIGGVSFGKDCRHWVLDVLKRLGDANGPLKP